MQSSAEKWLTAEDLALALTCRTKKGRPLRLHNSDNLASARAARAKPTGAVVYSMMILITTLLVERIAIGAVAKRGTFVANRRFQHGVRSVRNPLPLVARQTVAARGRMDSRQVQNLGGIQVTD